MKFKVGDMVRVRQWDDMADQYGIDSSGIKCDIHFHNGMKVICGEEFTIKNIRDDGIITGERLGFLLTEDMLESIDDCGYGYDTSDIDIFLSGMAR